MCSRIAEEVHSDIHSHMKTKNSIDRGVIQDKIWVGMSWVPSGHDNFHDIEMNYIQLIEKLQVDCRMCFSSTIP